VTWIEGPLDSGIVIVACLRRDAHDLPDLFRRRGHRHFRSDATLARGSDLAHFSRKTTSRTIARTATAAMGNRPGGAIGHAPLPVGSWPGGRLMCGERRGWRSSLVASTGHGRCCGCCGCCDGVPCEDPAECAAGSGVCGGLARDRLTFVARKSPLARSTPTAAIAPEPKGARPVRAARRWLRGRGFFLHAPTNHLLERFGDILPPCADRPARGETRHRRSRGGATEDGSRSSRARGASHRGPRRRFAHRRLGERKCSGTCTAVSRKTAFSPVQGCLSFTARTLGDGRNRARLTMGKCTPRGAKKRFAGLRSVWTTSWRVASAMASMLAADNPPRPGFTAPLRDTPTAPRKLHDQIRRAGRSRPASITRTTWIFCLTAIRASR